MQVIPVLDLLGGVVVRGVGGRRDEYRQIQSLLAADPSPPAVLDALRSRFTFRAAYVADLDGIMAGRPNLEALAGLARRPVELIVDAGVKTVADAAMLFEQGVARVVAATESLPSPLALKSLLDHCSLGRVVFSLDLKNGVPTVAAEEWKGHAPEEIALEAARLGATRFLLLDLADVGEGRGVGTLPLLERLRRRLPGCWFAVGGGVRSMEDVRAAEAAGADAVLVASALHDGRIAPGDLEAIHSVRNPGEPGA